MGVVQDRGVYYAGNIPYRLRTTSKRIGGSLFVGTYNEDYGIVGSLWGPPLFLESTICILK